MEKRDVQPIGGRQTGEACRLLEERGVDHDIFQNRIVENPDGLCFFMMGKYARHIGKTIRYESLNGQVAEIDVESGEVVGAGSVLGSYALGEVFCPGSKVFFFNDKKRKGRIISLEKIEDQILGEPEAKVYNIKAMVQWYDDYTEEINIRKLKLRTNKI